MADNASLLKVERSWFFYIILAADFSFLRLHPAKRERSVFHILTFMLGGCSVPVKETNSSLLTNPCGHCSHSTFLLTNGGAGGGVEGGQGRGSVHLGATIAKGPTDEGPDLFHSFVTHIRFIMLHNSGQPRTTL